jgi:hypothetical protein
MGIASLLLAYSGQDMQLTTYPHLELSLSMGGATAPFCASSGMLQGSFNVTFL